MKKQGAGSRFTGACMARVKFGKLLLLGFTLLVSASVELRASTDTPLPADMSFAYPISHAVTPLPNAVIETIADPEGEALAVEEIDDYDLPPEQPVQIGGSSPRALSRGSMCTAVAAVARANKLPIPFFANLIWQESNFDTKTISRAGAQGVAQFMPKTAVEYGLINPFEPIHALNVAGKFLRELYDQFGNLGMAAAAYNAGPRRVIAWMAKRGDLPAETRRYVLKVTGHPPEQWVGDKAKDPEVTLMPAKAPCVEVAKAVEEQAKVVRVAKLISELAEATAEDAPQGAGKSNAAVTQIARAKSNHKSPATRMAKAASKKADNNKAAWIASKARGRTKTAAKADAKTETKIARKATDKTKTATKTAEKPSGGRDSKVAEIKVAVRDDSKKAAKHATPRRHGGFRRTRVAVFDRHAL
jgi:hypothetical protein